MEERVSLQEALAHADRIWQERVEELRRSGLGYRAIAETLNEAGVLTANGKKWHATSISRLVKRKTGLLPDPRLAAPDESRLPSGDERDLLSRAVAGDRGARSRIRRLLGFEDPAAEREEAEMWEQLRRAKNRVNEGFFDGVDRLLPEAAAFGSCFLVQAHGIAAQRDRMRGNLKGAKAHLATARVLAAVCPDGSCHAEVFRREANLLRAMRLYRDALRQADSAVRAYEALGHSGHNLDGAGLESSMYIRAKIIYFLGRYQDSVKEFEACLEGLDPDRHEVLYCCATHGLSVALAECGPETQKRAEGYLNKLRKSRFMKQRFQRSAQLAYIKWLEGTLKFKLHTIQPCRARELVQTALGIFLARGMPDEARATVCDLALMARPRWDANPERILVEELLAKYEPALLALRVGEAAEEAIARLKTACGVWGWDAHQVLDSAIRALREAGAASRVLPCLLTSPQGPGGRN